MSILELREVRLRDTRGNRIGFQVGKGEIVTLLGANGAGKTSVMRAIIGELSPASGSIRLDGSDLAALAPHRRARAGIGYCPAGRRVFAGMSVTENLQVASFADVKERMRRIDEAMALFPQLQTYARTAAWRLSGGQQQMLAIARALMAGPRLLLLDEPSLGLAPILVAELLAKLRQVAAAGTAVLLAEQNIGAALNVADRAVLLAEGAQVAEGFAAEMARRPDLAALAMGFA
ncbi:MAG: ABC transporter ATP-binding protein [Alphaproteobacteria bacterium]|nr:ABC transporter ATP-binding protein [Alphaproteobacteria bacterium]